MNLYMLGDLAVNCKATAVHTEDKAVAADHEDFNVALGMKPEVNQVQLCFQVSGQGDDMAGLVLSTQIQSDDVLIVHLISKSK